MRLEERVDHLEDSMNKHLEESGGIRADLAWVKKFLWVVLASPMVTEAARHIWK